ncbi:hypothetical protein Tco_1152154 [Tanacetum coccineum]
MAPPGFAPVQNNGQNRFNQNQNQGNNFNRGNNFQGFQNQVNNVPNQGFQNQPFQAHNNQFQQGIPSEITSYMKANESIVRNMQGQINEIRSTLTKQEENLRKNLNDDMRSILGSFFQNQASTSGTLPSNTIPNPKGEMKAITTRSGVAYEGPSIPTNPSPKKVVERETEETTDKEQTNFQGSTAQIPPPVIPIPEPDVPKTLPKTTPIPESDIPKNLPKPNIPYPSRRDDQKSRDKASTQMEKIFQIFQDLRFDISFADALLLMPRFAPTIKSLLMNKEKLLELAKIPLNENCSAMLLKKLPEKLGDPGKFLIPCLIDDTSLSLALTPSEDANDEKEKQEVKNLAEPTAKRQTRITPCLKNFKDECLTPRDDIEFLLHHDPFTPMKSVVFILEGFINDPLFEENDDLFDLECKTNDWKRILYDDPIDEAECFDPGGDSDEIDTCIEEGYYDSEGDVLYLESLLSDDTTHNLSPDVFFDHEPQHIENESDHVTFSPKSDPLYHEFTGELITIPPGIVREHEDYINRMSLLYDDSIPPGIESDFDSEENIIDNLLNNDPIPEYERLTFDMKPDVPVINNVDELNEEECFDLGGGEINVEVDDSFTFVTRTFLPYLTYPEVSPLLSSTENEDTIFDPDIST